MSVDKENEDSKSKLGVLEGMEAARIALATPPPKPTELELLRDENEALKKQLHIAGEVAKDRDRLQAERSKLYATLREVEGDDLAHAQGMDMPLIDFACWVLRGKPNMFMAAVKSKEVM